MSSFRGSEIVLIDSTTDRVVLPVRFRKSLSPEANRKFVLIKGRNNNIDAYPYDQWQKVEEKLKKLNPYNPEHRYVLNIINMYAEDVTLDSQHRFVLPKELKNIANITDRVLFVSMTNYLALWNPDLHKKYIQENAEAYKDSEEKVFAEAFGDFNQ